MCQACAHPAVVPGDAVWVSRLRRCELSSYAISEMRLERRGGAENGKQKKEEWIPPVMVPPPPHPTPRDGRNPFQAVCQGKGKAQGKTSVSNIDLILWANILMVKSFRKLWVSRNNTCTPFCPLKPRECEQGLRARAERQTVTESTLTASSSLVGALRDFARGFGETRTLTHRRLPGLARSLAAGLAAGNLFQPLSCK
jgi:hypothetical protein